MQDFPVTGRFLDDFVVGDRYRHWPGRTITEADNIQFSLMTMNRHPLHCDSHFAASSEFGRPLVNSGLTLAIVLGMTVAGKTSCSRPRCFQATPCMPARGSSTCAKAAAALARASS
jgi:acyl dehydratase